MAEQQGAARVLKRRGILAAAGAVVAGIAAKQTAQPVLAASLTLSNNDAVTNVGTATTTLVAGSGFTATGVGLLRVDASTAAGADVDGVQGIGKGVYSGVVGFGSAQGGTGVFGQGVGTSATGVVGVATGALVPSVGQHVGVYGSGGSGLGVYGTSNSNHGVVGQTFSNPGLGHVGVYGYGNGSSTAGVLGDCSFGGNTTTGNAGVQGINAQYGVIGNVNNAPSTIGVWGSNTSTGAAPIGVRGDCLNGIGVYGSTAAAGQFGVIGQTLVANAFGLAGIANTDGSAAFAGGTTNANAFAASFQGHVQVFGGAFDVVGAGNKHAIVPHPDGTHRTIYSIESPECWVEDFGTGTLVAGKAEIALDTDFAALVHTDDYHVFLTSHGDYHIHTPQQGVAGFTVQVTSGAGKAASGTTGVTGTFSWRVVAKPKTDAKVERLVKATLAPKIDFGNLPKPPTAPPVAAPIPKPKTP